MNTTVPSLVCVPVLCISTYLVYLPLEVNRPLLCPRSWAATCSTRGVKRTNSVSRRIMRSAKESHTCPEQNLEKDPGASKGISGLFSTYTILPNITKCHVGKRGAVHWGLAAAAARSDGKVTTRTRWMKKSLPRRVALFADMNGCHDSVLAL